jgi:hypothetical protein
LVKDIKEPVYNENGQLNDIEVGDETVYAKKIVYDLLTLPAKSKRLLR